MTAINMIRQRRRAVILTDGAGYDANGVVRAFYQKAIAIPHLRAAVAVRGSANAVGVLAAAFGARFTTFDDLVANGGAVAQSVYDEFFAMFTNYGETEIEIHLAGWSEARNRPETYVMASDEAPSLAVMEMLPWTFTEADDCSAAPLPTDEAMAAQGLSVSAVERFDPVSDGLRVMEAQRRTRGSALSRGNGVEVYCVGGFAMLTEITESGVSQRIIHRWNDRVDELIDPFAHVPVMNMSRQQRRAMEREQLKTRH